MTVSNAPALCDAASLESTRSFFRRLFERLASFVADVPNANERANAVVKSLEVLHLESLFFPKSPLDFSEPSVDDWRRRVELALEAVERDLSSVESRSERAYLRRLALDAALALNACDKTFFVEQFADALLAEIDDAEERQNALVAYSTRLADRIYRFRQSAAPERAKAFALTEQIDDLRFFENAASKVVAAVLFDATRCAAAPFAVPSSSDATLDLTPFGDDVAEAWEQFESPGGFLELCERASAKFFADRTPFPPTPQEIALRQALNAETRLRLDALLTALDSNVDLDGSPLDEDVRDELQNVVDEAVIESSFALENGEFFRAFLERSRNLAAFFPIFERLAEAEKASFPPADAPQIPDASAQELDATDYYRSFYPLTPTERSEEKTRWLESARRVAAQSEAFDADLCVKLDRLSTYAELEFQFGDKTNGKNAVRKALGLLPRLESPFERARVYRRLVASHISSYPKTAQKLAALWKLELDAIQPEDLRDAALVDAFELYSQAAKLDADLISAALDSLVSPLARLECETRFKLKRLFSQPFASNVVEEIANLVDSALDALETFDEAAPDEAVFRLVKIATAAATELDRRPFSTAQTDVK
ncbi:MAG: hypothetical protein IJE97_14590 [Thermoguttaceae bacterium]|nr:hypothetical protein [Thermoguttaceae bacterium]